MMPNKGFSYPPAFPSYPLPSRLSLPQVILVLAGPAGAGKSTLKEKLIQGPYGFDKVVTTTCREPRLGKIDGKHYHFVTPDGFDALIEQKAFLEWAFVHSPTKERDRRYGLQSSSIMGPALAGKSLVLDLNVEGVRNLLIAAQAMPALQRALCTVFVNASDEVISQRMAGRQETLDERARRIASAAIERLDMDRYDTRIESGTPEQDFDEIIAIIHRTRACAAVF